MASLIAHSGALGDFITCLPAMRAWHLLHARERRILLGKPSFAALAADPGFDEVWDVERTRSAALFGGAPAESGSVDDRLRGVTAALVFATPASPLLRVLWAAGVPEIMRQDPFPPTRMHVVDYHLSFFPPAIAAEAGRVPRLGFFADAGMAPGSVALHPGSGSPAKNWPLDRFAALADGLSRAGRRVVWVLGPAEGALGPDPRARLWQGLDLCTLAARLAGCDCYVGNDSGVTHLAAAVGCPTVALFGASDAAVWAPRGHEVAVVASETGDMKSITVVKVLEALISICKDEKKSHGNERFPRGELDR